MADKKKTNPAKHDESSEQSSEQTSPAASQQSSASSDPTQFVAGGSGDPHRADESPNRDAIDGTGGGQEEGTHPLPSDLNESGRDSTGGNAPFAPADLTPAGPDEDDSNSRNSG